MMKTVVFGASAVIFALFLSALVTAVYVTLSGVPANLEFPSAIGGMLHLQRYEGFWWLGAAFCLVSVAATCWMGRLISARSLLLVVGGCCALTLIVRFFLHAPLPLARIGGLSPTWEFLLFYLVVLLAHVGAGLLCGYFWRSFAGDELPTKVETRARRRYDMGFTLMELLMVIAIIAILASLMFGVIARSKRSAKTTDDIVRLRQVYAAINLYENDYDTVSPGSLQTLVPVYASKEILHSQLDSRNGQTAIDWPANVWVDMPDVDKEEAEARSPSMISFGYLKPFHNRFPNGYTFAEYRNNPSVGLLIDPAAGGCREQCEFQTLDAQPPGQPAYNPEEFLVIRTDGSTVKRRVPACHGTAGFSYEQMFLFASFGCEHTPFGG